MKQRIALEAMSFSLIMGVSLMNLSAKAQDSNINPETSNESAVPAGLVQAEPIEVSPALAPSQVPVNVSGSAAADSSVLPVSGVLNQRTAARVRAAQQSASQANEFVNNDSQDSSLDAGVQSSNNKNGNGIQIFNLNTNDQDQDQASKQDQLSSVSSESRADVLRRERIRQELENESRLIEKIEEDRIATESSRANNIEGLTFTNSPDSSVTSVAGDLEVIEVAVAPVDTSVAPVAPVATVSSYPAVTSTSKMSTTQFSIAPLAGYRWTPNNNSEFRSENRGIGGVAVEGRIANIVGLEANYLFGRDRLQPRVYGSNVYGGYNNFAMPYNDYGFFYQIPNRETHEFNGNVKLGWFVGKVKPYALAGIGAMYTSYASIDDPVTRAQAEAIGWQRSSTHFVGNLGGGLDVKLADNFSIGARVEYQHIFGRGVLVGPYNIDAIYGDSKNRVKSLGSIQVTF